jgi:aspartyl/glutamyl-tRNA(Asn/Gln) amidotransferase C subunit
MSAATHSSDGGDEREEATGEDVVRRTAALARLSIGAAETRRLAGDFERILAAFRGLAEVDRTDGPGESGAPETAGAPVPRRADEPAPFAGAARLFDAAPDAVDDAGGGRFFAVPKTLEGPG